MHNWTTADNKYMRSGNGRPCGYVVVRSAKLCPGCGTNAAYVYRTVERTQYRKCENCGERFKTIKHEID